VNTIVFTPDGKLVALECHGSDIGLREIDFRLAWYYRAISLLIAVLTVVLARRAVRCWFRAGLGWQLCCLLSVATGTGLLFLGWYLSVFWVPAWGENTMPTEFFLFTTGFWAWFLGALLLVLSVGSIIGRKSAPRSQKGPTSVVLIPLPFGLFGRREVLAPPTSSSADSQSSSSAQSWSNRGPHNTQEME
jgi:hypothetical protein